jgi:oxygen-independent coproporphyrinogen-3 oxidase
MQQADRHLSGKLLFLEADHLKVSEAGKFLTDGIAANLFLVNLETND